MTDLWIATSNPKKRIELDRLLQPLGFELRLQSEAPREMHVIEDQPDFAGNARKKALGLVAVVQSPAIADDSGLCVDALDGRPGVHSARYAGEGATDTERNAKLLAELEGVLPEDRTARFICSICLAAADGTILATFEESCEGSIGQAPRGDGGFGYDPLFIAREFPDEGTAFAKRTTFAEFTPEQKDAISHRGKALRRLVEWLQNNRDL